MIYVRGLKFRVYTFSFFPFLKIHLKKGRQNRINPHVLCGKEAVFIYLIPAKTS